MLLGCRTSTTTKGRAVEPAATGPIEADRSEELDSGGAKSPKVRGESGRVLQRLLDAAVRRNGGFGGGVLRIESPSQGVLWEGASGRAARDLEAAMTAADTFEIASVTKTFTAVCVLSLVEEGVLDLDRPAAAFLPGGVTQGLLVVRARDYGPDITLRQLLNHTSGLPDYWDDKLRRGRSNAFLTDFLADPSRDWEPLAILGYVRNMKPIGVPGQRYHYSDSGYLLLGLLIEAVTGKSLDRVFRERLFAPLGMADTYLSYHEPPEGHDESHRYEEALDLHGQRRQSADWGGGGIVSSTRDLSRFLIALAQGKLFKNATTLDAMMGWRATGTPDVEYGLGLFRITLDAGQGKLWGHDGHGNAFMYYWPERRLAWVGTLNQTKNDWLDLVTRAMMAVKSEGTIP
jgi:D-alanyl-D-alanine carboxypeptidase